MGRASVVVIVRSSNRKLDGAKLRTPPSVPHDLEPPVLHEATGMAPIFVAPLTPHKKNVSTVVKAARHFAPIHTNRTHKSKTSSSYKRVDTHLRRPV